MIPLIGFAGWRLITQKQWNRALTKAAGSSGGITQPGLDSEFFRIEQHLARLGLERYSGETLSAWLARIRASGTVKDAGLGSLLSLHYRLRFDPEGLKDDERSTLRLRSTEWLRRSASSKAVRNGSA